MDKAIHRESSFKSRTQIYLACEEMDFTWCVKDVWKFKKMWKDGKSILQIAQELDRDPDEVLILAIDRCKKGSIIPRDGGLLGVMG